jgi:hypothetical protein
VSIADKGPSEPDASIFSHAGAEPIVASARIRLQASVAPTEIPSPKRDSADTPPQDTVAEPERRLPLPIASQPISDISSSNVPAPEAPRPVGYGNPPMETRFPPGNNANPKGRPPGAKNHRTILIDALNEKVVVTQNGRKKTMTKYAVGATKLANHLTETADPKVFLMVNNA